MIIYDFAKDSGYEAVRAEIWRARGLGNVLTLGLGACDVSPIFGIIILMNILLFSKILILAGGSVFCPNLIFDFRSTFHSPVKLFITKTFRKRSSCTSSSRNFWLFGKTSKMKKYRKFFMAWMWFFWKCVISWLWSYQQASTWLSWFKLQYIYTHSGKNPSRITQKSF